MNEKAVLNAFKQNWQIARNDGWTINNDIFYPPKSHEANKNNWATIFYKTEYGILVPHWFVKFYPIG